MINDQGSIPGTLVLGPWSLIIGHPVIRLFCLLSTHTSPRITDERRVIVVGHLLRRTSMRTLLLTGGMLAALASLVSVGGAGDKKRPDNVPPKGFTALFNGKDLKGWQGAIDVRKRQALEGDSLERLQKEVDVKVLPHWTVEDGVLVNDGKGGNLATIKDFT